jgi:multidrug resistance efflux pump
MNTPLETPSAPMNTAQAPARTTDRRTSETPLPANSRQPPVREAAGRRRHRLRHVVRIALTILLVVTATILGIWAFRYYEYSPWTRDGRISAYVVDSAPGVAGMVVEVPVIDNQFVKKDQLLYRIDPRDYQAVLQKAQASVAQAEANLELARAGVPLAEANHQFQILELERMKALSQAEEAAMVEINQTQRNFDVTKAELDQARATVSTRVADLEAAKAALYKAQIDLERCEVRAPVNGWVTNLSVRIGEFADADQRQISVIDADSYWITGYFEETRLRNVQVGAEATAVLMGYLDSPLLGHVESINRGIADSNLAPDQQGLPQVSPVFTWVRLAQRIPVRIHIDHVPEDVHIAIGETCTIYIEHMRH